MGVPVRIHVKERSGEMIIAFLSLRYDDIEFAHGIRRRVIRNNNLVRESQVAPDEEIENYPDRVCRAARPVEMILVGDKNNRYLPDPGGSDSAIHGITHDTIKPVPGDEPADTPGRGYHIEHNPFRAQESLFKAEEPVFPFKADFTWRLVEVAAPVLFHESMGFAVAGKMNSMPLLLQVMTKVQAAGSMPQPFSADNKKDIHGNLVSKHMSSIKR
jgi:hypothetical protein